MLIGASSLTRLIMGGALVALGNSGLMPIIGSVIGRTFGRMNFGRVMGLTYMFILVAALGPPLAGAVRDQLGSYDAFFLVAGVSSLLMGTLVLWLKPEEENTGAAVSAASA